MSARNDLGGTNYPPIIMDAKLYIKNFKNKKNLLIPWIDDFLSCLNKDALILDVGSGLGENADHMESKGFKVIRGEVIREFINFQKKPVIYFDIFNIDESKKFDAIFMSRFFTLFSPNQVSKILENCHVILKSKGIISFNLPKEWPLSEIITLLTIHNFELFSHISDSTWHFVTAVAIDK